MMRKRAGYSIAFLAFVMVLTAGVGRAWAYFTTYASAQGGITIELGNETEIEETFSSWTKHLTITSDAGSEPVYVRARAYGSGRYPLEYSGTGWQAGDDGYYYYNEILPGGGSTSELLVGIKDVPDQEIENGTMFNVIVIYESTPVMYNEDGTPYADWDVVLDNGTSESGSAQKEGE